MISGLTYGAHQSSHRRTHILRGTLPASPLFKWIWKSKSNIGTFFFLLLLRRNMFLDSYNCIQCEKGTQETRWHLFFECPFSQACWTFICIEWNMDVDTLQVIIQARLNFGNIIFREVIILARWAILCHRNNIIFYNSVRSFATWRSFFEKEMKLVTLRLNQWIEATSWLFLVVCNRYSFLFLGLAVLVLYIFLSRARPTHTHTHAYTHLSFMWINKAKCHLMVYKKATCHSCGCKKPFVIWRWIKQVMCHFVTW